MGRKKIQSGDPAEKADRDVLEVMVDIEGNNQLPLGLRVVVRFTSDRNTLNLNGEQKTGGHGQN
jgi:hypothetical protein